MDVDRNFLKSGKVDIFADVRRFLTQKSVIFIIKPTLECNFRCKYCYVPNKKKVFRQMSIGTFSTLIRKTAKHFLSINFNWLGGEPTLMPSAFYYRVLELQKEFNQKKGINFRNNFQTNGFDLDGKKIKMIGDLFSESVGVSYDGPWQDINRRAGSAVKVLGNMDLLEKATKRKPGIMVMISRSNYDQMPVLVDHLKVKGINSFAGNHLEYSGELRTKAGRSLMLEKGMYAQTIKNLWEIMEKAEKKGESLPICRNVSNFISALLNKKNVTCQFGSCVGNHLSFNPDGEVASCHSGKVVYGKINQLKSLKDIYCSSNFIVYTKLIEERLKRCLDRQCPWFLGCFGGCYEDIFEERKLDFYYCEDYWELFSFFAEILGERLSNCLLKEKDQLFLREAERVNFLSALTVLSRTSHNRFLALKKLFEKRRDQKIVLVNGKYYDLTMAIKKRTGDFLFRLIQREIGQDANSKKTRTNDRSAVDWSKEKS